MHIVSIPHTGTRFCGELFKLSPLDTPDKYTHIMTVNNAADAFAAGRKYHGSIVVPLRNPSKVLETWSKNNRHGVNQHAGIGRQMFTTSWCLLAAFCAEFQPYLLPVDHPDRERYLERIISDLKPQLHDELRSSWSKIGHNISEPQPIRGLDLALPFKVCELLGVHYDYIKPLERESVSPDPRTRPGFGVW